MKRRVTTRGFVLRVVALRESDVIVTFLGEDEGKVSLAARGARASRRRFVGALEPLHTVAVVYEDAGGEVAALREAEVVRPRVDVARDLACLDAAGRALRWARHLCPPRVAEPEAFARLEGALDALDRAATLPDEAERTAHAAGVLVATGLGLLRDVGYALEVGRCVLCGRARPPGRPAVVLPVRGGVVCTPCGGRGRAVSGEDLDLAAAWESVPAETLGRAAERLLPLVEGALEAHAGVERPDTGLVPGGRGV